MIRSLIPRTSLYASARARSQLDEHKVGDEWSALAMGVLHGPDGLADTTRPEGNAADAAFIGLPIWSRTQSWRVLIMRGSGKNPDRR